MGFLMGFLRLWVSACRGTHGIAGNLPAWQPARWSLEQGEIIPAAQAGRTAMGPPVQTVLPGNQAVEPGTVEPPASATGPAPVQPLAPPPARPAMRIIPDPDYPPHRPVTNRRLVLLP